MSDNSLTINANYAKLYFADTESPKATAPAKKDTTILTQKSENNEELFKHSYAMPNPHRLRNKKAQEKKAKADIIRAAFEKTKKQQKWLGKAWDWTKNLFGDKDGSENVEAKISDFEKGRISFEEAVSTFQGYAEGQEEVVNNTASIAGSIAAFGCYSYALGGAVFSPFTGGASLTQTALAIGFAGTASSATRMFIKGSNSDNYSSKDALNDLAKGYTDGLIAPVTAGAELLAIKGLSTMGMPAAQTALASIQNQVVVGFGKSTTKTATIKLANALTDATGESFKNGGIGIQINKEAMEHMTHAQTRELSQFLMGNAPKQTIQNLTAQATHMTANTSATPLIGGTAKVGLIQKTTLAATRGLAGGSAFGAISGGSSYAIDSTIEGTPFSLTTFGKNIALGAAGGAVAGSAMGAGGTVIGETAKAILPKLPRLSVNNNSVEVSSKLTESSVAKLQPVSIPTTTMPAAQQTGAVAPIIGAAGISASTVKPVVASSALTLQTTLPQPTISKPISTTPEIKTFTIDGIKFTTDGSYNATVGKNVEKLLKIWIKNNSNIKYMPFKEIVPDIRIIDFKNLETHLTNIKTLLECRSNYYAESFKNGFFSSPEGAKAFAILRERFGTTSQPGRVAPITIPLYNYSPKTILIAQKRNLLDYLDNEKKIKTLTKMSDAEYAKFQDTVAKSIKESGLTFPELKDKLISEVKSSLSDFQLDRLQKFIGEETVTAQIDLLNYLKKHFPLEIKDDSLFRILLSTNISNVESFKTVLSALKSRNDVTTWHTSDIIEIVTPEHTSAITKLLENTDVSLKFIKEFYSKIKQESQLSKLSEKDILEKFNNTSLVQTIRNIQNSDTSLIPEGTTPSALNPENIETSSLALVHMTNYEPTKGRILSTREKIGGSRNSVHFTLNHAVLGHRNGDWSEQTHAIIMPFESAVANNPAGKFIEGMPNDLYTNGSVDIPANSIIIKHNPKMEKGSVKISNSPKLKSVKIIETSELPYDVVPIVLKKMGYSHLYANSLWGGFNYGQSLGKSVEDAMMSHNHWMDFCQKNGIKPTMHTYSPGGYAEAIVENIDVLAANNSWIYYGNNGKAELLENIQKIKKWQAQGYFVSYDIDKLETIIRKSKTPNIALKQMKKELGFHPSVHREFFNPTPLSFYDTDSLTKTMEALHSESKLKDLLIDLKKYEL